MNLSMPSASGEPRLEMRDNFWLTEGTNLRALNCPPSGRVVQARYNNDDLLRVEFRNVASLEELDRRYQTKVPKPTRRSRRPRLPEPATPQSYADAVARDGITFPLAVAEITMRLPGTGLVLSSSKTGLGTNSIMGGWMSHCGVGIQIGPATNVSVPPIPSAGQ